MDDFDSKMAKITKSLRDLDDLSFKKVLEQRRQPQLPVEGNGETPAHRRTPDPPPSSQPPPPVETPAEQLLFSSPYPTSNIRVDEDVSLISDPARYDTEDEHFKSKSRTWDSRRCSDD